MRTSVSVLLDTDNRGNLPWVADYIVVNNPGNRWIYLPQLKKWIPPTYMNAIYAWGIIPPTWEIVVGTANGSDGQSGTPVGVTPGTGNTAVPTIEFVAQERLTPDPGTPYGVTINAGVVNLAPGTSVSISGTPTVNLGAGATVSISGTPTVTISGNVTFSNTQIAVLNVTGNLINVNSPPTYLGSFSVAGGIGTGTTQTYTIPAGTHSLVIVTNGYCTVDVRGSTTGAYYSVKPFPTSTVVGQVRTATTWHVVVNSAIETSYQIVITSNQAAVGTAWVAAVLSTEVVTIKTDQGEPILITSRFDHSTVFYSGYAQSVANVWTNIITGPGNGAVIQGYDFFSESNAAGSFAGQARFRGNVSGNTKLFYDKVHTQPNVPISSFINFDPVYAWYNDWPTDGQILVDIGSGAAAGTWVGGTIWSYTP